MIAKDATAYNEMSSGSSTSFLERWDPDRNPRLWTALNAACLASSVAVLIDCFVAADDLSERTTAAALYILWNFSTTLVWLAESGLKALPKATRTWEGVVEVVLAAWFAFDSLRLLVRWKIRGQDVEEDLIDVLLNCLGYVYMLAISVRSYRRREFAELEDRPPELAESERSKFDANWGDY